MQSSNYILLEKDSLFRNEGRLVKLGRTFYVSLTVHLSISLDSDQLDAHLLYFTIRQCNTTILDMFRALHMLILRRFKLYLYSIWYRLVNQWSSSAPDDH